MAAPILDEMVATSSETVVAGDIARHSRSWWPRHATVNKMRIKPSRSEFARLA
jgi:hypothetical protein